ncbi:GNAT family N-acetyltransferase [Amycolatopsis nigrescens]|uniref:GNAT family N-acetyltransferase n=1 Tax=Amycolatopsis nigrescens TaxID=381445 RepID=UPI00036447BE|nr:GNAT family N-acetyltransferase [Amycolatopsis nigrescens]
MRMKIVRADLGDPRVRAFLQAHLDDIAPTAPVESQHALSLAELADPSVRLWIGCDGDEIVGTAALTELKPGHEELKSMRTDPARRGEGIARRMLEHLLDDARTRGVTRISLETGSMDFFAPARALYAGAGFAPCGPFGDYVADPNSTFMSRLL